MLYMIIKTPKPLKKDEAVQIHATRLNAFKPL